MSRHTVWLDLCQRLRDVYLCEHPRAYLPFQLLPRPDIQKPQLITMLGSSTKSLFIETCFSLKRGVRHKKVILRSVPEHFTSDSPLFIADCELHKSLAPSALVTTEYTGGTDLHHLKWLQNIPRDMGPVTLAHLVYAQLLLPFSNVVCIFANDCGGNGEVAKFLAAWLRIRNRQPAFPHSTFARVLVLVRWRQRGTFDEKLATTEFLKQLRRFAREDKGLLGPLGDESLTDVEFEKFLKESAFELRLLALPDIRDRINMETFKTRLLCESGEIHNFRTLAKIAFSARHFQAFFQYACRHFANDILSPFDLLLASRMPNPLPEGFSAHLTNFVNCIPSEHQHIVPMMIASAMNLDSFPPGAHIFDPMLIFDKLYLKILEVGLDAFPNSEQIIQEIKVEFCGNTNSFNTSWIHTQLLQCFTDVWRITFSNATCLSCICRAPNSVLPCKHSFCDTCIVLHGRSGLEEPWSFQFESCPLCEMSMQTTIYLKPPTAGVRCLVLDSGSYMDLEVLESLEKELRLPIPIGEYFDIVHTSGLGAWIILEKFNRKEEYSDDYQSIRRRATEQRESASWFSESTITAHEATLKKLEGALKVLPRWSGTLHSSLKIQASLNSIFGEQTLFEFHQGAIKLGIIVSRSKDSTNCVLSNYNGDGQRRSGYQHIRERKPKNEILLSQCAKMSLSSKSVHGYHAREKYLPNEMIDIMLEEQDILWKRERKGPDILVALGARVLLDRAMSNKTPEWLVDFRLQAASRSREKTVDLLTASLFYIELIGMPQLDELGHFYCRAQVRCRISPSSIAYGKLIQRLRESRARFYYDFQSVPCVNQELHDEATRGIAFSRRIEMSVPSLHHSVDVKINGITSTIQRLSNCPYKLQQLVEDQRLHCVFGNKDHKMRYLGTVDDPKPQGRFI
ncbi:hypothetical protein L207DRAFT_632109 [Hyaloscypha variabilis F]|uniref:RING-type domain-containing protein n=1 Tax=Hyaloscypha variabilis (strain UAMH 11265 / GT02V1 / F) TaxID=1149755 RepID=A0A2J6RUX3_HYAVF|nr:hypothetical protein L207DRAFT_632109 [Hyaloscypha variabilis F]